MVGLKDKEEILKYITKKNQKNNEENSDLLLDIAKTEDNIDYINYKINNIQKNKKELNFFNTIKPFLFCVLVTLIFAILIPSMSLSITQIKCVIVSILFFAGSAIVLYKKVKDNRRTKRADKLIEPILEKELDYETDKLNVLKKEAKEKDLYYGVVIKLYEETPKIEKLKHKLNLIEHYCNNRKEYLILYKKNLLNSLSYSMEDIEFIKFIIEEELRQEELKQAGKENKNVKTKKLRK